MTSTSTWTSASPPTRRKRCPTRTPRTRAPVGRTGLGTPRDPGLVGAAAGLAAAALFGVSAPIGKWLVAGVDAQLLAGLLYAGAACGFWIVRAVPSAARDEAPLRRGDLPAVAAVALLGGVVAPVLMLLGLARLSAMAGSLLLNLEFSEPQIIQILTDIRTFNKTEIC